ncbi:MAG: hypothetical protein ACR5LA_03425 [Wolbachia sp.]
MAAAGTGMTREGYKGVMQVADTGIQLFYNHRKHCILTLLLYL